MPSDRPKFPFGTLNPIERSIVGRTLDPSNTNATDIIRESARNVFEESAVGNTGPLKGICLRVEIGDPEPNSWISNIYGDEAKPPLKSLKIRIPEIHTALPDPARYGPQAGSSHKIIDMYPTFIAASEDISGLPVAPGDIVLCDFGNRENLTHPIYLGPAFDSPSPGAVGITTPKDIFANEKRRGLSSLKPNGDNLFGERNFLSHLPGFAPVRNNGNQLNDPNSFSNRNRVSEGAHNILNDNMPSMRDVEMAYRNGRPIGQKKLFEVPLTNASKAGVFITEELRGPFFEMVQSAKQQGISLVLNSGFRSMDQQTYLYNGFIQGLPGFNLAARPGFSSHQDGTAIDFRGTQGGRSDTYVWLAKNAHNFGFFNSGKYFKKQRESWHWNYTTDQSILKREERMTIQEAQRLLLT